MAAVTTTNRIPAAPSVRPTGRTVSLLEGIDLFADVSPAELGRMARFFEVAQARPGQALETQGTPVRRWSVIASGQALVERDATPIGLLHRGESWSDYSLLNRQRSSIGVVALSSVTVLFVARQSFFHLLGDHPILRQQIVTRSLTSADRMAQPVFRALVGMEVAALRRDLATETPW